MIEYNGYLRVNSLKTMFENRYRFRRKLQLIEEVNYYVALKKKTILFVYKFNNSNNNNETTIFNVKL